MSSVPAHTYEIPRRPRVCRYGARLTVLKHNDQWHVWYVSQVGTHHVVWRWPLPGASTDRAWVAQVTPFDRWEDAMAHAATLRTYYGDQCRGDNKIFDRHHRRVGA